MWSGRSFSHNKLLPKDTRFPKAEHLNDDDDLHDDDHLFRPRQGGEVYWPRKHGTVLGPFACAQAGTVPLPPPQSVHTVTPPEYDNMKDRALKIRGIAARSAKRRGGQARGGMSSDIQRRLQVTGTPPELVSQGGGPDVNSARRVTGRNPSTEK